MRRSALTGLLLALALLTGACGSSDQQGSGVVTVEGASDDGYAGVLLPKPYVVPAASLPSSKGGTFDLRRDTRGKLTLAFFGYTHCPDVCQVVMGTIASSVARLSKADRAEVQVLFVTTDPSRDTTGALSTYLARLDPTFVGLTGSLRSIEAAGKPFGVDIIKGEKLASGGYDVTHTTSVIAIGGDGRAPLVWSATTSPAQMTKDIEKLLAKGTASPRGA